MPPVQMAALAAIAPGGTEAPCLPADSAVLPANAPCSILGALSAGRLPHCHIRSHPGSWSFSEEQPQLAAALQRNYSCLADVTSYLCKPQRCTVFSTGGTRAPWVASLWLGDCGDLLWSSCQLHCGRAPQSPRQCDPM